jgi:hypothetical protein
MRFLGRQSSDIVELQRSPFLSSGYLNLSLPWWSWLRRPFTPPVLRRSTDFGVQYRARAPTDIPVQKPSKPAAVEDIDHH